MKKISLLLSLFALTNNISAQNVTAKDVIDRIEQAQKGYKDYSVKIVGTFVTDNRKTNLDIDVKAIPALDLVRITFNAPDSLADNFVVIDKNTVSNYLFLTNQVTVSSSSKASVAGFDFNFAQFGNLTSSIPQDKFTFKPVITENIAASKVYVLDANAKNPKEAGFNRIKVWVLQSNLFIQKVQIFDQNNNLQADVNVSNWKTNVGFVAKDLRKIPADAEIIKK